MGNFLFNERRLTIRTIGDGASSSWHRDDTCSMPGLYNLDVDHVHKWHCIGFQPLRLIHPYFKQFDTIVLWYLDRFSWVILGAAILMTICQIVLLFFWVKLSNRARLNKQLSSSMTSSDLSSKSSEEPEKFQNAFWYWDNFMYYVICIMCMIGLLTMLTIAG